MADKYDKLAIEIVGHKGRFIATPLLQGIAQELRRLGERNPLSDLEDLLKRTLDELIERKQRGLREKVGQLIDAWTLVHGYEKLDEFKGQLMDILEDYDEAWGDQQ